MNEQGNRSLPDRFDFEVYFRSGARSTISAGRRDVNSEWCRCCTYTVPGVNVDMLCHRLMVALESDNQTLVDGSLVSLEQIAERSGYPLPPSIRIPTKHST